MNIYILLVAIGLFGYALFITIHYIRKSSECKKLKEDLTLYELLASQKQYTEILRKSNRDKVGEWKKR